MNRESIQLGEMLRSLIESKGNQEYGFLIQGLAAHLLLYLGMNVLEVNRYGHPDIVAKTQDGNTSLYEIEAEVSFGLKRNLTPPDFVGLKGGGENDAGYFALLRSGVMPRWLVVPAELLRQRSHRLLGPETIYALSDVTISDLWTRSFIELLSPLSVERLTVISFERLRRRALRGRIIG